MRHHWCSLFGGEIYANVRDDLDSVYQIKGKTFDFKNIEIFNNSSTRNFLEIMKILSEHGYCTASEIAEKDSFTDGKIRKKDRSDIYRRKITGDTKRKFQGLIQRNIIKPENSEWWKTKNNKFRLSFFGVLYSIRLFSKRPVNFSEINISKTNKQQLREKTIIDILTKNYSEELPLVFKKWKFFEKEISNIDSIMYFIAHHIPISTDLLHYPFFDTNPFDLKEFENESDTFANEFTILFLGYLYLAMSENIREFQKMLSKDKEIYKYYEKYLSLLDKVQRVRRYEAKAVHCALTGQFSKRNQMLKKRLDLKGRPSNSEITEHLLRTVTKLSK